MKRVVSLGFVALAGIAFLACTSDDSSWEGSGGGGYGCEQYTTCGSCTPVSGCGWCSTPSGQGLCASSPDECANVTKFTWTWDPEGCFVPADASVGPTPIDAGPGPRPTADAAPTPTPTDAAPASEASSPAYEAGSPEASVEAGPSADAAGATDASGATDSAATD